MYTTPPATPRQQRTAAKSPPPAPRAEPASLLMRALRQHSTAMVREAIQADPEVARYPFWDHQVEPPLCFAVRCGCAADIIELLLQHGADPDAKDLRGRTPADIVRSTQPSIHKDKDFIAIEKVFNVSSASEALPVAHEDVLWGPVVDACWQNFTDRLSAAKQEK